MPSWKGRFSSSCWDKSYVFIYILIFLLLLGLHNFLMDYKHFRVRNFACTVLNIQSPCPGFVIISLPADSLWFVLLEGKIMWYSEAILKFLEAIVPAFPWLLCMCICWSFKTTGIAKHFEKWDYSFSYFNTGILPLPTCYKSWFQSSS